MAHFAQLDDNNVVLQVIVVSNDDITVDGEESEARGVDFCQWLLGADTQWAQTSYSNSFRYRFAGIGFTFDPTLDAFIAPSPFPSWKLNPDTTEWEAPVPYPDDGVDYIWDEEALDWAAIDVLGIDHQNDDEVIPSDAHNDSDAIA